MASELTESQNYIIRTILIIGSSASLSSTLIVFIIYWFFKENRSFIHEMTMWFSISIITFSISNLLPYDKTTSLTNLWCPIQSYFSNSSLLSQNIWCAVIGYCGLITMIKRSHLEFFKYRYRIIFTIVSYCLPLCISLLIIIPGIYGSSDGFCWIDIYTEDRTKKDLVFKMVMTFFLIDWFCIIINLYFIIKLVVILRKNTSLKNNVYAYIKWFPIVNTLCEFIAMLNRLCSLMKWNWSPFGRSLMQTIGDSFQGCVFMVIFVTSPGIYQSVVIFCRRVCQSRNKNSPNEKKIKGSNDYGEEINDHDVFYGDSLIHKTNEKIEQDK